jgi:hypothetical protein
MCVHVVFGSAEGPLGADGVLGPQALRLLHTRYHAVPKLEAANPMVIKW